MTPRSRSGPSPAAILLAPGAGADRTHHTLVAVEKAAKAAMALRLPEGSKPAASRIDFPYRKAGRRAPDKAPVAVAHVGRQVGRLVSRARCAPEQVLVGGRSYGGRMCSLAVAEGLPAAGLVLLSYPLHPPGQPDKLRVEHFDRLDLPVLFVGGERDPFGSPATFARHVASIPGPVTQVWLPGGHDPRNQDEVIAAAVVAWMAGL